MDNDRATEKQVKERVKEALLLLENYAPASIVRILAKKYDVSPRQARRYVKTAITDSFDAPLTTDELGFSIANSMERLERIADAAAAEGDRKIEITATKAVIQAAENRLKAIQRMDETALKHGIYSAKKYKIDDGDTLENILF